MQICIFDQLHHLCGCNWKCGITLISFCNNVSSLPPKQNTYRAIYVYALHFQRLCQVFMYFKSKLWTEPHIHSALRCFYHYNFIFTFVIMPHYSWFFFSIVLSSFLSPPDCNYLKYPVENYNIKWKKGLLWTEGNHVSALLSASAADAVDQIDLKHMTWLHVVLAFIARTIKLSD